MSLPSAGCDVGQSISVPPLEVGTAGAPAEDSSHFQEIDATVLAPESGSSATEQGYAASRLGALLLLEAWRSLWYRQPGMVCGRALFGDRAAVGPLKAMQSSLSFFQTVGVFVLRLSCSLLTSGSHAACPGRSRIPGGMCTGDT